MYMYTVGHKTRHKLFAHIFVKMTNFNDFFSVAHHVGMLPHFICVATLPCKIQIFINYENRRKIRVQKLILSAGDCVCAKWKRRGTMRACEKNVGLGQCVHVTSTSRIYIPVTQAAVVTSVVLMTLQYADILPGNKHRVSNELNRPFSFYSDLR